MMQWNGGGTRADESGLLSCTPSYALLPSLTLSMGGWRMGGKISVPEERLTSCASC